MSVFDDGAESYASVMRKCGLEVGRFALQCFENIDCERIKGAQRQAKAASHEAGTVRRRGRKSRDEGQRGRVFHILLVDTEESFYRVTQSLFISLVKF